MSSSEGGYVSAKFKNKKLAQLINNYLVIEKDEEEWVITSEDESFIYLGKPYNNMDFAAFQTINKSRVKKENLRPNNVYVETHTRSYFDLAKLLGIRDTCLGQKGDKTLTKKEALEIIKALNHGNFGFFMPLGKGRLSKNTEKWLRLSDAYVDTDEKGITTIGFGSERTGEALAVLIALSKKFPKTRIELEDYYDYYSSREPSWMHRYRYVVKNGNYKQVEDTYESESWDDYD